MAFQNPAQRKPASAEQPKTRDRSIGIRRAGGVKAAPSRKQRRQEALIKADQRKSAAFHKIVPPVVIFPSLSKLSASWEMGSALVV